ncbi:MAG: hypothetical protein ACI8RZ_007565, partial [Myxococcota bacterium]
DATTDLSEARFQIGFQMQRHIKAWETEHDAIADQYATQTTTIDDETREMLETMGYVE